MGRKQEKLLKDQLKAQQFFSELDARVAQDHFAETAQQLAKTAEMLKDFAEMVTSAVSVQPPPPSRGSKMNFFTDAGDEDSPTDHDSLTNDESSMDNDKPAHRYI